MKVQDNNSIKNQSSNSHYHMLSAYHLTQFLNILKMTKEDLKNKLTDEQLERIVPKSEIDVIMYADSLLRENGFHPALVLHFMEFVKVSSDTLGC